LAGRGRLGAHEGPEAATAYLFPMCDGAEFTAKAHCDQLMCLDEMGEASAETVSKAADMLANGVGKVRAGRDGAVRPPPTWRVLFLSSGEEGLADRLTEAHGGPRQPRAGQQVRVVDIPADAGGGSAFSSGWMGRTTRAPSPTA